MTMDARGTPMRAALTAIVSLTVGLVVAGQPTPADHPVPVHASALRPEPACTERVYDRLFFGLGTSEGAVSDAAWSHFLAAVMTPRFPDGLTVIDAHGQWRAPSADNITIERSRVVEIAHDDSPAIDRSVDEAIAIYKHRHRQRAVMRTRARVEVCL
jgi:hypothetical protein